VHVFFRLAVPANTMPVEVRVRERSLGQINLPLLTRDEFLANLKVTEPTVHARLKDGAHVCQAYVTSQAKEVIASLLLTSPTSLAPLADFELGANLVSRDDSVARQVARLGSNQLAAKQALVVVPFAKPPGRIKEWDVCWTLDRNVLATRTIRGISAGEFDKSLRISTTRLRLEAASDVLPLARIAPQSWAGISRVGPVFLVCSGIAGMAAAAKFSVRAVDRARTTLFEMPPFETLVTDGPTIVAPGTLAYDDRVDAFELWCGKRRLGEIPLSPAPVATFTGEGGIAARRDDFAWSPQAEAQLQEKLDALLGGA
jgi:hypothetical protein